MNQHWNLRYWLLALSVLFSISVYAQDITVTGTVIDELGDPLIGAAVVQKGARASAITDIDGKFSIKVPSSSTLVFSYTGYTPKEEAVNGRTTVDVQLTPNLTVLDEVVAIGYGKVRKKDLTGAVSSVAGSDLATAPVTSTAAALQGKVAGVNIVSQSAAPGAKMNITVRGGTSLTQGTEPLYIVDGFVMSDALANIDVNDIETIDVLKDASSTAIYGARGSNGIIVITTKSAKKGKTKVDYNGYVSFERLDKKLDMISNPLEFAQYQYEYGVAQQTQTMWSNYFDNGYGEDQADFYTGAYARMASLYSDSYALDWQDEAFGGHATTQNHNVSVSTGSENTQALISYNYTGQDGLLANHDYRRNSLRAKINSQLWKGVRLDFSTFFYDNKTRGGGSYSGMKSVLLQPINGGTRFTQDQLLNTQTYPEMRAMSDKFDTANPLVQNLAAVSEKSSRRWEVNAGITIDFLDMFTWRTAGNYSTSWSRGTSFANENGTSYLMDPINTGMAGSISNGESSGWHISNTLTFQKTLGKHGLTVLLGQEYSESNSLSNSISLRKFSYPNHGLDDISNAECYEKSSGRSSSNMLSFFGRANYNYDDRYLLTATMRADGSSRFAKGHKWGYFPSVAAAWRISQESFWQEGDIRNWFNNLKFRVGYGVTGNNNIGSNLYATTVTLTTYPMDNNENAPAYVVGTTLGNNQLKWETLHATNIGLDLGFFNNRISLTLEWYNNQISDMLMKCTIPSATGYKSQYQNVGKMRNRGIEIQLNTVNIATKDFTWTTNFNISFNRSKVISLEGDQHDKTFSAGDNRAGTVTYYATVGQPLGDMYGYKYEGIYTTDDFIQNADGSLTLKDGVVRPFEGTPQPGDIKFAADSQMEDGNPQFTRKMVKIGNGTPDFTGGFGNTLTYKGFDLYAFFKFSYGNDMYNATAHSMSPYAPFQNIQQSFADNYYRLIDPLTGQQATSLERLRELNPNESERYWSLSPTNTNYITYPNSFFVEDASYLRLAQLTLGYTLPKHIVNKAKIDNVRVYFTANNLFTWTNYSGYNPDASAKNDNVICTPGYDSSTYPMSKSYVVGINLSF